MESHGARTIVILYLSSCVTARVLSIYYRTNIVLRVLEQREYCTAFWRFGFIIGDFFLRRSENSRVHQSTLGPLRCFNYIYFLQVIYKLESTCACKKIYTVFAAQLYRETSC